jgi:cell division septal protein FtsQ
MATSTPPPYFPQSSLSPPDEKRYRKFKLAIAAGVILVLLILGGIVVGLVYLLKWLL